MTRLHSERVLVTGAALADGTSDTLVRNVSLQVDNGVLTGLWTNGEHPDPHGVTVIDGAGATIVPG